MPWRYGKQQGRRHRPAPQLPDPVAGLLNPAIYPEHPRRVELIQTHLSYVFLAGEHVYKVKKPVDFGFVHFTTLEQRRYFCHREVELNSRLAPNVYLGVVPITQEEGQLALGGGGQVVEYAVKMRRLPQQRMMNVLLPQGQVTKEMVARVAQVLARFHEQAQTSDAIAAYGHPQAIAVNTEENFQQTEKYIGVTITPEQYRAITVHTRGFLREKEPLFVERMVQGRIRDCHGDVHSEHVCLEDGISIYDCIEFNERFRYCDVAAEIAFLAMDLDFHGHPELSRCFVESYLAASGDRGGLPLLNFYKAYRAYVRGKVDSFELDDPAVPPAEKDQAASLARRYFELAHAYIRPPLLVVMTGMVGTGKTSLAVTLGERRGMWVLSSDVVRKELAGISPTEHRYEPFGEGIYSPEFTRRTYDELLRRARDLLEAGQGVVLDASFGQRQEREQSRALAQEAGARLLVVECYCDETVLKKRLETRLDKEGVVSDGRWEIYLMQRQTFGPPTEVLPEDLLRLDTGRPTEENIALVLKRIAT